MKKLVVMVCYAVFIFNTAAAQNKYWIFLRDKPGWHLSNLGVSEVAIKNRIALDLQTNQYSDHPVSKSYIDFLTAADIKIVNQSKWLNAVTAYIDDKQVSLLKKVSFVESVQLVHTMEYAQINSLRSESVESLAFEQINSKSFEKTRLTGEDVVIGVIDGGFEHADRNPMITHLFNNNKILGTRNFVDRESTDFFSIFSSDDGHGSLVLQMIAGYDKEKRGKFGFATDASFYLAVTDHSKYENRKDEDHWIAGLEWMDSLGVRLVHSSLGYSQDYDDPKDNYAPMQMDGKTSAIARAAQLASEAKGMVIVVSAGNEGANLSWKVISTPADAKGVISVGATDKYLMKSNVSGTGPTILTYVKPDISCFSAHGTSLSAPVITGLIACMMQWDNKLTNEQLKKSLAGSGHLYPYPNNYLGYGIPNADRMINLLKALSSQESVEVKPLIGKGGSCEIVMKKISGPITIFHKSGEWEVLQQHFQQAQEGRVIIYRQDNASRSTVVVNQMVFEILWEK